MILMTVKELIALLEKVENKDLPVYFNDSEYGTEEFDGSVKLDQVWDYSKKKEITVIVVD